YKSRIQSKLGADFTTSPWAYGRKIFLASEQGEIFAINAGPDFEVAHVETVGELAMASPAIVGDRLLFRSEKRIMSIRKQN
ncbi:MAG TPA: serine/threonine protein kinase, partial [Pirellulaceae bacterium]|nr:serine/threonine protein kinase [Pirellulaceae bacterium]